MSSHHAQCAASLPENWAGDYSALLNRLSPAGHAQWRGMTPDGFEAARLAGFAAVSQFLENFASRTLCALELPAVCRAYGHACRGEFRELMQLDAEIGREPCLLGFGGASARVGQEQLRRLRPLRDHRLLQRYIAALDHGEAMAWHSVVFGVLLSVHSLPLRQGLHHYAHQVLGGLLDAASRDAELTPHGRAALWVRLEAGLTPAIDALLAPASAIPGDGSLQHVELRAI